VTDLEFQEAVEAARAEFVSRGIDTPEKAAAELERMRAEEAGVFWVVEVQL
jgi:hypothetical protein